MRESDFDQFSQMLAAEAEIRNTKPLSEGALLLWWQRMQRFDLSQLHRALARHANDPDRGRFMPQPADLIRFLEGSTTDKAALAWGKAIGAASSIGGYTDVVFDDPLIHAVVEDIGGWPKFCRTETKDLSYLQHRFQQSYAAYAETGATCYPRVLGGDRSDDSVYKQYGIAPPRPARVGDVEKCRAVMRDGRIGGRARITFARVEDALPAPREEAAAA